MTNKDLRSETEDWILTRLIGAIINFYCLMDDDDRLYVPSY